VCRTSDIKHRLRVFEKGVLRDILRAKREEVTGDWRKLHKEELHELDMWHVLGGKWHTDF